MVAINFIFERFLEDFRIYTHLNIFVCQQKIYLYNSNKEIINTLFDQIGLQAAEISVMKDYVWLVMELSKL